MFLANGVSPVNANGFAPLDEASTIEVLDFYKKISKHRHQVNCFNNHAKYILLVKQL